MSLSFRVMITTWCKMCYQEANSQHFRQSCRYRKTTTIIYWSTFLFFTRRVREKTLKESRGIPCFKGFENLDLMTQGIYNHVLCTTWILQHPIILLASNFLFQLSHHVGTVISQTNEPLLENLMTQAQLNKMAGLMRLR